MEYTLDPGSGSSSSGDDDDSTTLGRTSGGINRVAGGNLQRDTTYTAGEPGDVDDSNESSFAVSDVSTQKATEIVTAGYGQGGGGGGTNTSDTDEVNSGQGTEVDASTTPAGSSNNSGGGGGGQSMPNVIVPPSGGGSQVIPMPTGGGGMNSSVLILGMLGLAAAIIATN